MDVLSRKDFHTHLAVVGGLQIVSGLLGIILAALAALILGVGGETALRTMTVTAAVIGTLVTILSIPKLVAGIGLLRRAAWSRVMALALSAFELFVFPFGTLLALYTVFVLSQRTAVDAFGACCELEKNRIKAASA